jgi:hypothetical protein
LGIRAGERVAFRAGFAVLAATSDFVGCELSAFFGFDFFVVDEGRGDVTAFAAAGRGGTGRV